MSTLRNSETSPETGRSLFPGGGRLSRRDFVRTCVAATCLMGLPPSMTRRVVQAAERQERPAVVWLHFQECTGCSVSLLHSDHPTFSSVILELVSLDYHETLMAGAGAQAERALHESMTANNGRHILVVEGAVPTAANGAFCRVGGRTALESLSAAVRGAALVIAIGTCASFGGIQAAAPNPTGAVGIGHLVGNVPLINVPGCPPSPHNFLATLLYYLTFKRLPELDALQRPKFAYGRTLHDHCERRPHFDAGRFAQAYGDAGHARGHCLYKLGCKGPVTHANCSVQRFNQADVWPVSIGHPCIGCTEGSVLFRAAIADKVPIREPAPFEGFAPAVVERKGRGADPLTTGLAGLGAGLALGAGLMLTRKLPHRSQAKESAAHENHQ